MTQAPSIKDALWKIFEEAHDKVSYCEPTKARRAGLDAVLAALATLQPSGERREAIALELLRRVRDYGGIEPQLDIEIDALLGSGNET